jgi:hypothetical protein
MDGIEGMLAADAFLPRCLRRHEDIIVKIHQTPHSQIFWECVVQKIWARVVLSRSQDFTLVQKIWRFCIFSRSQEIWVSGIYGGPENLEVLYFTLPGNLGAW